VKRRESRASIDSWRSERVEDPRSQRYLEIWYCL